MNEECQCSEGFLIEFGKTPDGGPDTEEKYRLPIGSDLHDCAYVAVRDSFIPSAEGWANLVEGKYPPADEGPKYQAWARDWNVVFLMEMDRLVRRFYSGEKP